MKIGQIINEPTGHKLIAALLIRVPAFFRWGYWSIINCCPLSICVVQEQISKPLPTYEDFSIE